jgi:hypothetical protein
MVLRRNEFPVLQAFWPAETGHFPWSENSDGWIATTQQRLDLARLEEKANDFLALPT